MPAPGTGAHVQLAVLGKHHDLARCDPASVGPHRLRAGDGQGQRDHALAEASTGKDRQRVGAAVQAEFRKDQALHAGAKVAGSQQPLFEAGIAHHPQQGVRIKAVNDKTAVGG
ncbi:hypothetical protein B8W90_11230, partial [Staphylococcus hominis]